MQTMIFIFWAVLAGIARLGSASVPTEEPTSAPVSSSIYNDWDEVGLTPLTQQIIVGILTVALFIGMVIDYYPPEVLFLIALVIVMLFQILTLPQVLSGFSNEAMITIGVLFLVVGGVERSHVVDYLARKTFGAEGSLLMGKARLFTASFAMSIFFNNTPLVAILLPVVKDWGRMRDIAASQLLMPLSYSVLAGSFVTMIGTSTNLTIQGLMQADRGFSFPFFAPAYIGCPMFVMLLTYILLAGPVLLPNNISGLIRTARDKASTLLAEVLIKEGSPMVGKSIGEMMNALGVSPSYAIKIRRKRFGADGKPRRSFSSSSNLADQGIEKESKDSSSTSSGSTLTEHNENNNHSHGGNANHKILDFQYVKRMSKFWKHKPSQHGIPRDRAIPEDEEVNDGEGYNAENDLETANIYSRNREGSVSSSYTDRSIHNEEEYMDILAPQYHEIIDAGDIVFISSAQDVVEKMMKSIAGESKGLAILDSNVLDLPGFGTELVECIISDINPFLGRRVGDINREFAERYNVALITVRGKTWEEPSKVIHRSGSDDSSSKLRRVLTSAGTSLTSGQGHGNRSAHCVNPGDVQMTQIVASDSRTGLVDAAANEEKADRAEKGDAKSTAGVGNKRGSRHYALENFDSMDSRNNVGGDFREGDSDGYTLADADGYDEDEAQESLKPEYHTRAATALPNSDADGFSGDHEVTVSDHILCYGDIVLGVTNETQVSRLSDSKDFFVVSQVGALPRPLDLYRSIPVGIFFVMLVFVAAEFITMPAGSLTVTAIFFIGGWIDASDINKLVNFRLLMIIACALSFAKAMTESGLALEVASTISKAASSPFSAMLLTYLLTLVITELVSNNAAAAIMYPIAVALADELEVSFKPFAMCVLIASTACFMSPISYQTHVMVWGPGGYTFVNFLKFGMLPDLMYWLGACLLIPTVYPY